MRLQFRLSAIVAALTCLGAASAQSATLLSDTSALVEHGDDTSFNESFTSVGGGLADLSFAINGFNSLDGANFYEDDFTLSLNGAAIFSGTFNLGGGGNDEVFIADPSASVVNVSGNGSAVTWAGGQVNVTTPLTLVNGANVLTFGYTSLTAGHAGPQSLADEGWDATDIVVDQSTPLGLSVVGVIPEPTSWALILMGFASAGAVLRGQRRNVQTVLSH